MYVYAGIDEAGYGPMFGPLVVGCAVFAIRDHGDAETPPDLWALLKRAVSKKPAKRRTTIAVNDSKKLYTPSAGLRHLETAALTFAGLGGHQISTLEDWLVAMVPEGERPQELLPWYSAVQAEIPCATTSPQIAIAGNVLSLAAKEAGVSVPYLSATPVFEDRFNQMTLATRSKAAVNFTFIAKYLVTIWQRFCGNRPTVVIDRQSGRMRYRELLSTSFPQTQLTVLDETPEKSCYYLSQGAGGKAAGGMTVVFQTKADEEHLPTAMGSIVAKYTRELLMDRFNAYFAERIPDLKPTAGYAQDGKRFWNDLQPHIHQLDLNTDVLRRNR